MTNIRAIASMAACLVLATACTQSGAPAAEPGTAATGDAPPVAAAAAAPGDTGAAAGTKACMIAGAFEILGQTIRSRDCLQAGADIAASDHRELCEGLAQTSAQLGGEAGELTWMDACPTPAQGSCRGIFGQATMHAFYYERTDDDLATLPASCRMGGGTWLE